MVQVLIRIERAPGLGPALDPIEQGVRRRQDPRVVASVVPRRGEQGDDDGVAGRGHGEAEAVAAEGGRDGRLRGADGLDAEGPGDARDGGHVADAGVPDRVGVLQGGEGVEEGGREG